MTSDATTTTARARRAWGRALLIGLIAAAGAAACATGRFMELTSEEQSRFNRCRDVLRSSRCANDSSNACMDRQARAYADQPSEQERRRFLVSGGCPMSVARGETPASAAAAPPTASSSSGGEAQ